MSDLLPVEPSGVRMSQTIGKLADALAKAQAEMEGASKDSTNPHFKSKYADLAAVRDACRPLAKHGIAHLQPTKADGARVTVTTMLIHSSGEWIAEDLTLTAGQATPQAVGSAITYGRRYGLAAMVGIAPEDDDGEAAEGRGNGQRARHEAPAQAAPAAAAAPTGFGEWWADLQSVADEGSEALRAAFLASPNDKRKYLTDNLLAKWEALKEKASKVKKVPVSA